MIQRVKRLFEASQRITGRIDEDTPRNFFHPTEICRTALDLESVETAASAVNSLITDFVRTRPPDYCLIICKVALWSSKWCF